MKIKHALGALATGLALAWAPAQAGVVAMADLAVTSLGIVQVGAGGTPTGSFTALTINSESRTGNASASYNGVDATGIGSGNKNSNTVGATVDVNYRCAGECNAALLAQYGGSFENRDAVHISNPVANYALGDMLISGSAFVGLGGPPSGLTRADAAALNPTNEGSSNAVIQNQLKSTTTFTANTSATVAIGVGWNAFVRAWVDGLNLGEVGAATANTKWSLQLFDITVDPNQNTALVNFVPSQMNKSFSSDGTSNATFEDIGNAFSTQFSITGGHQYQVIIAQSSSAIVSLIPEPGSLALVGLALFGLGAVRSRRSK